MTFKALLLGSAAALATAGGAQAADLMAESVDYVKICDAFGTGYWYIPGTDTCLKIGGQVQFNADAGELVAKDGTEDGHNFRTTTQLKVTAAKMTAHGPLIGFMNLKASNAGEDDGDNTAVNIDEAYIQWGHLLMGYTDSLTKVGGGYNFNGDQFKPNAATNLIAASFTHNGWAISVGIEDSGEGISVSAGSQELPALTAQISGEHGIVDWALGLGYVEGGSLNDGFVITGAATFNLDHITKGDRLQLTAGWGDDAAAAYALRGAPTANGDYWVWMAAFKHKWSSDWESNITYSATGGDGPDGDDLAINLKYMGVPGFFIGPEVRLYDRTSGIDTTTFKLRAEFNW